VDAGIPIIAPSFARQVLRAKLCAPSFARQRFGRIFHEPAPVRLCHCAFPFFIFAAGSAKAAENVKIGVIYPLIGSSLKSCRDDCR